MRASDRSTEASNGRWNQAIRWIELLLSVQLSGELFTMTAQAA